MESCARPCSCARFGGGIRVSDHRAVRAFSLVTIPLVSALALTFGFLLSFALNERTGLMPEMKLVFAFFVASHVGIVFAKSPENR